jgi:site-specific recombinase XerD
MRLVEIQTSDQRKRYVVIDDERGYARNTLRSYGGNLKLFFDYLAQKGLEYGSVTLDDLAGFVHWLKLPYGSIKVLPGHPVAQARGCSSHRRVKKRVSAEPRASSW